MSEEPDTSGPDPSTSTRAYSRKNRVFVFREFLLQTYSGYLDEGSTLLDVAGGKGDLSWLLSNVDKMNSVVADPRVTKQQHLLRSVEYLRRNPEEARKRAVPGLPTFQPLATLIPHLEGLPEFSKPRHLRVLVDQALVDAIAEYLETQSTTRWAFFWSNASEKALTCETLGYKEPSSTNVNQVIGAAAALKIILETRLVVGFHPDQATEACIDLALLLNVPFCVVPCCVFPSEFPERKTNGGTRVKTHPQLVEYLMRKTDEIRQASLNFHFSETAKNLVLYTLPGNQWKDSVTKDT